MTSFKRVVIIYNPNSTRDSKKNATDFKRALVARHPSSLEIDVIPTTHAGHALEIAREHAQEPDTVVVSSSGDGGYNEVINGVLMSGGKAATAVLPAGNANDHHASAGSGQLIDNIIKGRVRRIETLEVRATVNGNDWQRYAHSYVGFGLTPKLGRIMTERRPNVLTEKWYVLWHSLRFRHVKLRVNGKRRRYSNLLFSTITRMSKVMKLDSNATLHDGKMEVYATRYLSPLGILRLIISASVIGVSSEERVHEFKLRTVRRTLVQLDGEVFTIDAKSDVVITCHKDGLRTVI